MSVVLSLNVAATGMVNPAHPELITGIDKRPYAGPIQVRDPGPRTGGLGSGLVGDVIGDSRHHGGDRQAVYAFAREELDHWQGVLQRPLPNGAFGENLTTAGVDPDGARIGERWRVGAEVELEVTFGRIPCNTFRTWMDQRGWLKTFTAHARPGAYFRVVRPGAIRAGDRIEVVTRPDHDVTVALAFQAVTTHRELLPELLAAQEFLDEEILDKIARHEVYVLG